MTFTAKKEFENVAELAMFRSPAGFFDLDKMKPCRTKGLYEKLIKRVDGELRKVPKLDQLELYQVFKFVDVFGKETGWVSEQLHIVAVLSFCARLIEKSKYTYDPRIIKTINELVHHFYNGKDFKEEDCKSGDEGEVIWIKLMKEHPEFDEFLMNESAPISKETLNNLKE